MNYFTVRSLNRLAPNSQKPVFLAQEATTKARLVVNFTDSYSVEAHRILAENGALLAHEKLNSIWQAVVMEYIETKALSNSEQAEVALLKAMGIFHSMVMCMET
ncbi:hypothetical protein Pelo_19350 [Pelomyxa schiedti]|nr:hypothetical protein Pelo_19350 [Pelomyxa schiedti]